MHENIKDLLLEESGKLNKENKLLQKQLSEAKESLEAIQLGSIDALVITNKQNLTIYTDKTADKIYRLLIEKMNEGAVTLNKKGTILFCNTCFAKLVHLPLQEIIGTKFDHFIDANAKKRFANILKHNQEYDVKEEAYLYAKNGNVIPVLMSLNTLALDNDFVLCIILTDLTIQNQNQEELKRKTIQLEEKNIELESANKDLTSFTYLSSHDLQEPLRKIQTFTSILLQEEDNLSETAKGYFQRIRKSTKRMQSLIEDLLLYAGTKNSERRFEKTDLTIVVDEVKKDFEEVMLKMKATIEVSPLCEVNIIRSQMRQLISNLVSNSLKFSKPNRRPRIKIKSAIIKSPLLISKHLPAKIDYCHVTYSDNGIGFDPKYGERIFEVFQRLHSKEEFKGTGMGLAICKRVMENHNGIISASGKLNRGARFDIFIPAIQ